MTYSNLTRALNSIGINMAEGAWRNANDVRASYGVYALDNAEDLTADGRHVERILEGTVDLYAYLTRGTDDARAIETALADNTLSWHLNYGPRYEMDTGYTHWEWVYRVLEG